MDYRRVHNYFIMLTRKSTFSRLCCFNVDRITVSDTGIVAAVQLTVNLEIFARILFSRIVFKDIYATSKFVTRVCFTYISKRQSDFAISREFYYHEASHIRSFAKIKPSRKFPNLQYLNGDCIC